jgi:hypothetical protein
MRKRAQHCVDTFVQLQEPLSDEVIALSSVDQQAQRKYARNLLVFHLDDVISSEDLVQHLTQALAAALSELPVFAATLVPRPGSTRNELQLQLGPDSGVLTRVKDYTQCDQGAWPYGSFADLAARHFPLAHVPTELLFVETPDPKEAPRTGIPVCTVQLNFIDGGLIIGATWHHTAGDGRSVNFLVRAWARHFRASITDGRVAALEIPAEETRARWLLNYGHQDGMISEMTDYIVNPAARDPCHPLGMHLLDRDDQSPVPFTVSTWVLSATALQSLVRALATPAPGDDGGGFTQSEAIAALVWKHLSIARQLGRDPDRAGTTSLCTIRLDLRARLLPRLPEEYIGNINEPNARIRLPLQEICRPSTPESLATLAGEIRKTTEQLGNTDVRNLIGLVNTLPNVTDLTWGYDLFPGPDLSFTDTSGLDLSQHDWGAPLGYPVCARPYGGERGVAYVLPRGRDGAIELQLQAEREAVERLKEDEVFGQYAAFCSCA